MGLAAVYGTIKSHKGTISLRSEIGQGSTFELYLPLAPITAKREKEYIQKTESNKGKATILLVEDEEV